MGIIIGSPLQQGVLARRYDDEVNHGARWLSSPRRAQYKRLYSLMDDLDIPLAELAVRFVISNPDISTTLMGARSVVEVEANVAAVEAGPLPADLLDEVQKIADMVLFDPSRNLLDCLLAKLNARALVGQIGVISRIVPKSIGKAHQIKLCKSIISTTLLSLILFWPTPQ